MFPRFQIGELLRDLAFSVTATPELQCRDLSPRAWGGVVFLGLNLAVPSGSLKPAPLAWQQGELASVWLSSL